MKSGNAHELNQVL